MVDAKLEGLMSAAKAERKVILRPDVRLVPFVVNGVLVGFHGERHTVARLGETIAPLYVAPEHRGQGIALLMYAEHPGVLVACVNRDNTASERLHEKAGFVRWRRYSSGWWWRRECL